MKVTGEKRARMNPRLDGQEAEVNVFLIPGSLVNYGQ